MRNGRTDGRHRSLINFLAYCPKGIVFIKSIDASAIVTDAQLLCNLFSEIVNIVGAQNVIHLVTDNGSNFKGIGRLLNEKYENICWSPCAAHCLNLILQDISKMPHVVDLAHHGSHVTKFLYNHKWSLGWLRKRPSWTKILRPSETRFAITFIALKSLHDHKLDLQTMVTSFEFHGHLDQREVKHQRKSFYILSFGMIV